MADYTSRANVILTMNGRQAEQMLNKLEKEAASLEKKITAAAQAGDKVKLQKLQRELAQTRRLMDQIKGASNAVEQTLTRLDKATPKELNKALRQLQNQLNGIERGSEAWDAHIEKIKAIKEELRKINDDMRPDQDLMDRFNEWWEKWQNAILGAGAVITGLVMAGRQAVNAYADMEQEMANVRKFTGMSGEEVESLNEAFKRIDTRTSREELNKLAQEAGRLGKTSEEDVLGFVRAADKINVALDDLGSGATLTLSKLTGIFGDEKRLGTERSLLAVGSVINELSQNCSASAPYLAEFTSRMGGVGAQAGLTVQQIMAFGAVLDSNNQACEASATALSQVITRIYQDPAKYARVAGIEVEKFTKLVKTDMNAALIEFFSTLNKAGSMKVLSPMFKDMGENGARSISAMSTLAARIADVTDQQKNANAAFSEATSIDKEFEVQNTTIQAGLEKAQARVHELSVSLGQKLQPAMKFCISSATLTLKIFSAAVDFFIKYKSEVLTAVGAIVAYNAVMLIMNTRTLIATTATKAFSAAIAFSSKVVPALRLLLVPLINTVQYFTNGLQVNYAMQQRWRTAMSAMKFSNWLGLVLAIAGAVYVFTKRIRENRQEAERLRKEQEEYAKSLTDINEASADYASKEISRLDALYKAATNDADSKDNRRRAAERLQKLYPEIFKNFSTEQIMLGQTATAYNKLRDSILEVARARAAADKIVENQKLILTLQEDAPKLKKFLDMAQAEHQKAVAELNKLKEAEALGASGNSTDAAVSNLTDRFSKYERRVRESAEKLQVARNVFLKNEQKIVQLGSSNNWLAQTYKGATDHLPGPEELKNPELPFVPSSVPDGGEGGGSTSDRFATEKEWRERSEAEARIAYATGQSDYIAHTEKMNRIAVEYYDKLLKRSDLSETERLTLKAEKLEAEAKVTEQATARSVEDEEKRYNEQLSELKQFYIDGSISKESFDIKAEEAEIEHQRNLTKITNLGAKERLQAEGRLSQLLIAQMERRQAETEKKEAELADFKKEFFGDNPQERQANFDKSIALLQTVYDRELAAAADNAEEKLRIEEAFERAKLALKKRYGLLAEEDSRNGMQRWNDDAREWLEGDVGKAVAGSLDTVVSGMSAIFSQVSTLMQADLEIQTASINKRYADEVAYAEGNTFRIAQLEREKQAEIAKVKNEANRKMFAIQVSQAVAQTAQNALSAYGSAAAVPIVGYILAPIAAAMAVAAGAIQIAAIKRQQQASVAQGYSRGGFTRRGRVDEPAGVVHAGEWVASQKLVNSPKARPIIDALEYAQRTNTIGSLSPDDVSRSITAPIVLASQRSASAPVVVQAPPASVIVQDNPELTSTLKELKVRLSEPFVTVNTVAGDFGIQKAQDDYAALLRNKSPKSKR